MRLDRTFIAIRPRSAVEILDLALQVIRVHARAWLTLLVINALPFAIWNFVWTMWMLESQYIDKYLPIYFWLQWLLVLAQSHLGTVAITSYLGSAMFEGKPSIGAAVRSVFRRWGALLWLQGGIRLAIPVSMIPVVMTMSVDWEGNAFMTVMLFLVVAGGYAIRLFAPFVNEMIVLEKTPLRARERGSISFHARAGSFHSASYGGLFGRGLLLGLMVVPLTISLYSGGLLLDSALSLHLDPRATLLPWYWPPALWLVAGYAAVVRFLTYIDMRIRQEGWSVELRMRAEAERLVRSMERTR